MGIGYLRMLGTLVVSEEVVLKITLVEVLSLYVYWLDNMLHTIV